MTAIRKSTIQKTKFQHVTSSTTDYCASNDRFGIKVPPASGTTNGKHSVVTTNEGMRRRVHPPCLFKPYDVRNHHFVYILPNLSSVAILPFWWYLHMRLWFFVHFFIYALTFFGTKHFSSRIIFKNYLHTYTKPLNTH